MKCDRVRFKIALEIDSEVEISALTHPTMCSPLGSHIDLHLYPHLQGLQLADRSTKSKECIYILIGADFYHNIVIGEVLRGGFGLIAISGRLGWLLSGPVAFTVSNHNDFNDVASHLIIDSTVNSLSLGLHGSDKGKDSSELVQALNEFLATRIPLLHEHPNDKQDEKRPQGTWISPLMALGMKEAFLGRMAISL